MRREENVGVRSEVGAGPQSRKLCRVFLKRKTSLDVSALAQRCRRLGSCTADRPNVASYEVNTRRSSLLFA
jgi:hypothetical protein